MTSQFGFIEEFEPQFYNWMTSPYGKSTLYEPQTYPLNVPSYRWGCGCGQNKQVDSFATVASTGKTILIVLVIGGLMAFAVFYFFAKNPIVRGLSKGMSIANKSHALMDELED